MSERDENFHVKNPAIIEKPFRYTRDKGESIVLLFVDSLHSLGVTNLIKISSITYPDMLNH